MYYQRVAKCKRSQWPRINCWIRQASFHGDQNILKFGTCFFIHEKEYDSEILFLKILSPIVLFSTMESIELIIFRYRQCFDQLTLNIRSVRSNNSFKIHIRSINDLKTRHRYRCGNLTRGQTLEEMRKRLDRSSTRYTNLGSNFSTCCFNILFSHFVTIFSPDGRWPRV